ncbi:ParA family protein [Azospirillum brasilense]|uniref:ParA family protein n=1 Tax=Azospirillum brasilense TaxID=192 RepID=UPI001EDB114D|nr:ParA family protein [Azospirillum brasilense]UKJ76343.1 ParA family protein [Azospirillum brasilense]
MVKTILVTNWKGGTGKTTVATNLLAAIANSGLTVAGLDTDAQPQLAEWWEARPEQAPALSVYIQPLADLEEAPTPPEPVDVLVIDTPPGVEAYPESYRRLIEAADLIVVPSSGTSNDRRSTSKVLEFLHTTGKPVVVVLNRLKPRALDNAETKRDLARIGADLCPVELPDLNEFHRAFDIGVGVVEVDGAKASDDVDALWAYLRKRLGIAS